MSDSNKFEKGSPAYITNLWAEYQKCKGYDDGGEVKKDDDSTLSTIGKALQKAFSAPSPTPAPTPSDEDKAEKVREQNRKNFDDPMNNPSSQYYKPGMADGGVVEDSPLEGADQAIDAEQNTQHAIDHDAKIPVSSYTKLSPDMGDVQYAERLRQRNKDAGYADGGQVRKSMAQRQNENIQVIDPQSGQVKRTVPKYKSADAEEPTPEASPSLTTASSSDGEYQDDPSKPLMKRLKDYGDAVEKMSDEDVPSYAMGGTADQQQNQLMVMDIPKKMSKGGKMGYDDGGQVSGPNPNPDQEKSAQEKIVDILHRVTNPQYSMGNMFDIPGQDKAQDLMNQALPKYADGGQVDISPVAKSQRARQDAEISHNNTGTPASLLTMGHQVNPTRGAVQLSDSIPNYANGGMVDPSQAQIPGTNVILPQQAAMARNLASGNAIAQGQQMAAMKAATGANNSGGVSFSKPPYTPVKDPMAGATNVTPTTGGMDNSGGGLGSLISNAPGGAGGVAMAAYKGGKVPKKEEHDKKNLKGLKKSFDKFIDEEGKEYNKGGKVRHYADGSDGAVQPKVEQVQGPEEDIDTQAVQRGMYIPDDQAQSDEENRAEAMADNSTQGQINQELANNQDQPDVEVAREPASKDDETDHRDVVLPADTVKSIEDIADVDPEDRLIQSDADSAAQIPPAGRSADEQAAIQNAAPSLMDQLKSAQRKQSLITALQGIGEGGSLIGAGLAGRGGERVTPVNPAVFRDANAAALPMQHFMQQLQMDKEDPNSPISKTYQDHIIAGLGNTATPQQIANIRGSSANNLDKFLPQQTKLIYGQNQINAKKSLLQTRIDAQKDLAQNRIDFQSEQNDLNRQDRDKIAAMAQEGMKQRFDTPTLDRITNEVRNDPLVKPVILKKASVDESLHLLDNSPTVHPALLSDANFAFTQAMNLQPGATTQKRYDASKITDLNQRVHAWVANNLNNPDADMKSDDPALYNLLHGYLTSVSSDYGDLIDQTQSTVLNTKKAAYNAMGRQGIVSGITAMQGSLGNAGRGPVTQQQNGPAGGTPPPQQATVTIKQKSTGLTKTIPASRAQKYLSDPDFEKVGQ